MKTKGNNLFVIFKNLYKFVSSFFSFKIFLNNFGAFFLYLVPKLFPKSIISFHIISIKFSSQDKEVKVTVRTRNLSIQFTTFNSPHGTQSTINIRFIIFISLIWKGYHSHFLAFQSWKCCKMKIFLLRRVKKFSCERKFLKNIHRNERACRTAASERFIQAREGCKSHVVCRSVLCCKMYFNIEGAALYEMKKREKKKFSADNFFQYFAKSQRDWTRNWKKKGERKKFSYTREFFS